MKLATTLDTYASRSRSSHPLGACRQRLSLAISAAMIVLFAFGAAAYGGPKGVIQSSHAKINKLLRKEKKSGRKSASLEAEMKKVINRFLDFDALAKASMSRHWDNLTAAQRKEFVGLFRQLIESSYIKRLRGDLNYKVVYGKVDKKGDRAVVHTTVERMKRGRKDETSIVYKLKRASGRWQVYDVVTNQVSLAQNYRSSFGRIMRRNGYATLIRKMKRKIKNP
jgi:phospholipid transport system substrate-binding protein